MTRTTALAEEQPPRDHWSVEVVEQRTESGVVLVEYALKDTRNGSPFLLNNHKVQARETHQRILLDPAGNFLHVSGVAVPPTGLDDFLATDSRAYRWVDKDRRGRWRDDRGRVLAPYLFAAAPWAGGALEELDPQWQRETYLLPLQPQVDDAVGRYLAVAESRLWTGDRRGTTLNLQVGASAGDAFQVGTTVAINGVSINVDDVDEWFGAHWTNATIAAGSTIDTAFYSPYINGSASDEPFHILKGEDSDSAAAYATTSDNINARPRTTASDSWDDTDLGTSGGFEQWGCTTTGGAGVDLKAIIQEIVDRAGWASGNNLALIHTQISLQATRDLQIDTYDSSSAKGAKLDITYTSGAGTAVKDIIGGGLIPFAR